TTHAAGGPGALCVRLAGPVADLVVVELQARAAEGVGLVEVRAGLEIAVVNPAHDGCVRVVPELRAAAVAESGREEGGAVAAVEDETLARLGTLDYFPAARSGHQVAAATPRRSLARL